MNNVKGRNVRSIVSVLLLGAWSLIGGQYAFAGGSPPEPTGFSVDLPANVFGPGVCAFPINVSVSGEAAVIDLPGNRTIITAPKQRAVITNLDETANTVAFGITGVFHQSTDQNGNAVTVVTGRNLLGDPEAGFVVAIGIFSFIFDSNGNLVQPLTGTGRLIDVCESIQ